MEKQRNGRRMYILTAIDIFTRTTCAIATKSHSSQTFAHFFFLSHANVPFMKSKCFDGQRRRIQKTLIQTLTENKITHYHTYPKTPKMNAHCESFNGTIQEEFVDYNVNLLFDDTTAFNEKTERVFNILQHQESPLGFQKQNDVGCGLKRFQVLCQ